VVPADGPPGTLEADFVVFDVGVGFSLADIATLGLRGRGPSLKAMGVVAKRRTPN